MEKVLCLRRFYRCIPQVNVFSWHSLEILSLSRGQREK